ncbi:hypothetical protein CsSME_00051835 [Camellia sinensis var. sinensis]
MKLSFLQCSSSKATVSQPLSLLHNPTTTFTFSCSLKPKVPNLIKTTTARISATSRDLPARDRVIDFGRHRGKMLGTLPSSYLKWVSNNLRARDLQEWAVLADQVLDDPVYRDRIEWEFAQKVLNGDDGVRGSPRSEGAVSELLEISERFGWDNDDKVGWSRIDFGILGTSKGGRIPRRRVSEENCICGGLERESKLKRESRVNGFDGGEGGGRGREMRRERMRMRMKKRGGLRLGTMEKTTMRLGFGRGNGKVEDADADADDQVRNEDRTVESESPFPGRQSLLQKVLNSRKRFS